MRADRRCCDHDDVLLLMKLVTEPPPAMPSGFHGARRVMPRRRPDCYVFGARGQEAPDRSGS